MRVIKIPTERIGEVIGPGGKVIRNIRATTGATVDVNDDGSVFISGTDADNVQKAVEWVEGLTHDVEVNEEFEGEVKRILPFGAFVEILPGKEGMVHVSQMTTGFVDDPNKVVSLGQKVKVRVMEIDDMHRINLSMLLVKMQKPSQLNPAQVAQTAVAEVVEAVDLTEDEEGFK